MSKAKSHFWDTSMKWGAMTGPQKFSLVVKTIIAACTFGFVYPNVWD